MGFHLKIQEDLTHSLLLLVKDLLPSALKPRYHGNGPLPGPLCPSPLAQASPALPCRDRVPPRAHGRPGVRGGSAHLAGGLTPAGSCGEVGVWMPGASPGTRESPAWLPMGKACHRNNAISPRLQIHSSSCRQDSRSSEVTTEMGPWEKSRWAWNHRAGL